MWKKQHLPEEVRKQYEIVRSQMWHFKSNIFASFQSSPPPFCPEGRSTDIDAVIDVISRAERFIYISVMDYFPLQIYTSKPR